MLGEFYDKCVGESCRTDQIEVRNTLYKRFLGVTECSNSRTNYI